MKKVWAGLFSVVCLAGVAKFAAAQVESGSATAAESSASGQQALKEAEASIDPEKIRAHVRFLADDLLEGRGPGLRGSELAAKYIATQFALDGLKPGGDHGTYFQQVKFVGMNASGRGSGTIASPNRLAVASTIG